MKDQLQTKKKLNKPIEFFPEHLNIDLPKVIYSIYNNKKHIKYSHKIKGRWENQYLALNFVPEIKEVLHYACKTVKNILGHDVIVPYEEMGFPTNEFWFNIAEPGQLTDWHDHKEGASFSGVYYLEVPKKSGDILFRIKHRNNLNELQLNSITGKMILFDSNIEHSVSINNSNQDRISLGFNIYLLPICYDSFSVRY